MRLMLVCAIAVMLPTAMDSTARMVSMPAQWIMSGCIASTSMRMTNANAASLGAEPMNMVIAVGAPWYTSGTHMWKGKGPSLNARLATMNAKPNTTSAWIALTGWM